MTIEQYNKGKELKKQIDKLDYLYKSIKDNTYEVSMSEGAPAELDSTFHIITYGDFYHEFLKHKNEIESELMKVIKNDIDNLKKEIEKI